MGGNGNAAQGSNPVAKGNPHHNPDPRLTLAGYQQALRDRNQAEKHREAAVVARLEPAYAAWRTALTADETQAVHSHQGHAYRNMNRGLRYAAGGDPRGNHLIDHTRMQQLDALISRGRVPHDTTVYRGRRRVTHLAAARAVIGTWDTDHGYVSTSVNVAVGEGFALRGDTNGTLYQITVPAGSHAAWLHSLDVEELGEHELLLPRGSEFLITDVSQRAHPQVQGQMINVIHMRVVPPAAAP